jgi:hypothetical protein
MRDAAKKERDRPEVMRPRRKSVGTTPGTMTREPLGAHRPFGQPRPDRAMGGHGTPG